MPIPVFSPLDPARFNLRGTVANVVPFSVRETPSVIYLIEHMRTWLNNTLVPYINDTFEQITDDWVAEVEAIIEGFNEAVDELNDDWIETTNEIIDAFNDAVQQIINDSIEVQDPVVAGLIGDDESATRQALDIVVDENVQIVRYPEVVNNSALTPARQKLLMARREPCRISVLGDSISWGVGVDGNASSSSGAIGIQQDRYRENAWPIQLAAILNDHFNTETVNGFLGPAFSDRPSSWAAATSVNSTNTTYNSALGTFGDQPNVNRGGAVMTYTGWIEWSKNTLTMPFDTLEVLVFGGDIPGASVPDIYIDGVRVRNAYRLPAGAPMLHVETVTGIEPGKHTVRLAITDPIGGAPTPQAYGCFIRPRNSSGIVVDRNASPSATSANAIGTAWNRTGSLTVQENNTDLLIVALGTNDCYGNIPVNTLKTNLQTIIDRSTAPVLLLDTPIKSGYFNPYTNAIRGVAESNASKVAFAPLSELFGSQADASERKLFPTNSTVHPSWLGARKIAEYVAWVIEKNW